MAVPHFDHPLVPGFKVLIDGRPLPVEAEPYVMEVTVDIDAELVTMFSFELSGGDSLKKEVPWVDDTTLFEVGNAVELKIGYGDDLETLISGEITALEPQYGMDSMPSLTIRGYDRRHRLQRGPQVRTFVQQKDSDIASQIARDLGLNANVKDTKVVHDYVMQANQTDMNFLKERARQIHYDVVVKDRTLHFLPISNADSEVLTLTKGSDLLEFSPRLSVAHQASEVTVRGWDAKQKKEIIGRAGSGDEMSRMGGQRNHAALVTQAFGKSTRMLSDQPVQSQAEADQLAKSHFNEMALALITGEGVCWGRTDLKPGKVIRIDGVGSRFGGQYYVTSTCHRYSSSRGYYTDFSFQRNAS